MFVDEYEVMSEVGGNGGGDEGRGTPTCLISSCTCTKRNLMIAKLFSDGSFCHQAGL